jgi:superfamily I DNA/RNA helicase
LDELMREMKFKQEDLVKEKIASSYYGQMRSATGTRAVQDVQITITTIISSKGLAADYVFLMDFSDDQFGKGDPKEQNIYDFLVAITRARKRLYLISPDNKEATFLSWIQPEKITKRPLYTKNSFRVKRVPKKTAKRKKTKKQQ